MARGTDGLRERIFHLLLRGPAFLVGAETEVAGGDEEDLFFAGAFGGTGDGHRAVLAFVLLVRIKMLERRRYQGAAQRYRCCRWGGVLGQPREKKCFGGCNSAFED